MRWRSSPAIYFFSWSLSAASLAKGEFGIDANRPLLARLLGGPRLGGAAPAALAFRAAVLAAIGPALMAARRPCRPRCSPSRRPGLPPNLRSKRSLPDGRCASRRAVALRRAGSCRPRRLPPGLRASRRPRSVAAARLVAMARTLLETSGPPDQDRLGLFGRSARAPPRALAVSTRVGRACRFDCLRSAIGERLSAVVGSVRSAAGASPRRVRPPRPSATSACSAGAAAGSAWLSHADWSRQWLRRPARSTAVCFDAPAASGAVGRSRLFGWLQPCSASGALSRLRRTARSIDCRSRFGLQRCRLLGLRLRGGGFRGLPLRPRRFRRSAP